MGRLEWITFWNGNVELEYATLERTVGRPCDAGFKVVDLALCLKPTRNSRRRVLKERELMATQWIKMTPF